MQFVHLLYTVHCVHLNRPFHTIYIVYIYTLLNTNQGKLNKLNALKFWHVQACNCSQVLQRVTKCITVLINISLQKY